MPERKTGGLNEIAQMIESAKVQLRPEALACLFEDEWLRRLERRSCSKPVPLSKLKSIVSKYTRLNACFARPVHRLDFEPMPFNCSNLQPPNR